MTFKEFNNWCNDRACDGHWGFKEAVICLDIIKKVYRKHKFRRRKREKYWKDTYENFIVNNIVNPTNEKIESYKLHAELLYRSLRND